MYAKFAYTQIEICTCSRPSANFAYTQKWQNCGHMDRFAYVSKICVYAKFAYVSKSSHVTGALDVVVLLGFGKRVQSLLK